MDSSIFPIDAISFSNGTETLLPGGRKLFPLIPQALDGIKTIGFIGWWSQGPSQSQNFRDTLHSIGSDIIVRVGLRQDSASRVKAREAGFREEDGTLADILDVVRDSDFLIVLIADGGMVQEYKTIFANMKPWATLGLSHGFLKGYLDSVGEKFREGIDVVLMAPKGMWPSLRRLYIQGSMSAWAGINSSVGVEQNVSGRALDRALAWAVATGSPVTFETTLTHEVRSDLFGERGILLGGIWAIAEVAYEYFREQWAPEYDAFMNSSNALVGIISERISEKWLKWAYESLDANTRHVCEKAYNIGYTAGKPVLEAIYSSVCDGREISEVITQTQELKNHPLSSVETSPMWQVGKSLYKQKTEINEQSAFTLGLYMGIMIAQIDLLRAKWHNTSEIVNESLIEAIDSLNPYMWARGVAYMVDNCSITARLGTRKWGPEFMKTLREQIAHPSDTTPFTSFLAHPIHGDINICFSYRPSVKIAVE